MSGKILIVEDEKSIREFIKLNLNMSGFETKEVATGEAALVILETYPAQVIILDLMLPGIDGLEVCRKIREQSAEVAIIMLTAKGQDMDKIIGLETGADDYLIKPFNPLELIARIRALLRRMHLPAPQQNSQLVSGIFTVDFDTQTILKDKKILDLTPKEYVLAKVLIENCNKALSRNDLLNLAWGEDFFGDPKTLDVHIRRLREKLEENPSEPQFISTIWGYGYMWRENKWPCQV